MNKLRTNRSQMSSLSDRIEHRLARVSEQELALQPSPVWPKAVTWALIGTTVFGIGWLALARTEEIVVASGKLEPIGQVRPIQMPIGGVAEQVLVKEGEHVKKGQILMRLDSEASRARLQNVTQAIQLKQGELALKREELARFLQLNDTEQRVLTGNLNLQQEILRRFDRLNREGATAELQYLQQRDRVQQIEGELAKLRDERQRQEAIQAQSIKQLQSQLAELNSQRSEHSVTNRYQVLRSPVDGLVFGLKPTSAGFVAQSSEPVMEIVPFASLQASVQIPSSDIGFVKVGQPVDVSIDSFPSNEFGSLSGTVKRIGSDALPPDPQVQRSEYRYPADISLASQQLRLKSGQTLALQPGMSLQANIKLRKVSYLELLLGVFRKKADSLRQI